MLTVYDNWSGTDLVDMAQDPIRLGSLSTHELQELCMELSARLDTSHLELDVHRANPYDES